MWPLQPVSDNQYKLLIIVFMLFITACLGVSENNGIIGGGLNYRGCPILVSKCGISHFTSLLRVCTHV